MLYGVPFCSQSPFNAIQNHINYDSREAERSSPSVQNSHRKRKEKTGSRILDGEIVIPRIFWETYCTCEAKLLKGWTDALAAYLKSVQHYDCCVFSFASHKCNTPDKKRAAYFYTNVECLNSECAWFRLEAHDPILAPFRTFH